MDEGRTPRNPLGAGGIGTVTELLVAALRRVNLSGSITLMDAGVVEAGNLGHQRYTDTILGKPSRLPRQALGRCDQFLACSRKGGELARLNNSKGQISLSCAIALNHDALLRP